MAAQKQYSFSTTTSWGSKRKLKNLGRVLESIVPDMDEHATIVEAGSGRGEFAQIVRDRGCDYIGIEPSDQLRAELTAKGFFVLDEPLPQIRMDDQTVDLVYCNDTVEHLSSYVDVLDFFNEAHRILRRGGHITVIVPNAETIGPLFHMYEYQHSFVTTLGRIEALMRDSGFDVTHSRAYLTNAGLSRWWFVRAIDRVVAHTSLLFGRSVILNSMARAVLGRDLLFRIHKNLCDHIAVVGRKSSSGPAAASVEPRTRQDRGRVDEIQQQG